MHGIGAPTLAQTPSASCGRPSGRAAPIATETYHAMLTYKDRPILFVDLEASALDPDSYPVEVGWSPGLDGVAWQSVLILPTDNWRLTGSWRRIPPSFTASRAPSSLSRASTRATSSRWSTKRSPDAFSFPTRRTSICVG